MPGLAIVPGSGPGQEAAVLRQQTPGPAGKYAITMHQTTGSVRLCTGECTIQWSLGVRWQRRPEQSSQDTGTGSDARHGATPSRLKRTLTADISPPERDRALSAAPPPAVVAGGGAADKDPSQPIKGRGGMVPCNPTSRCSGPKQTTAWL